MSNFGELKDKINEWSADEEDIVKYLTYLFIKFIAPPQIKRFYR